MRYIAPVCEWNIVEILDFTVRTTVNLWAYKPQSFSFRYGVEGVDADILNELSWAVDTDKEWFSALDVRRRANNSPQQNILRY
jgi:hypothetical protein